MRSTWTDSRLDDFKTSVDSRLDDLKSSVDARLDDLKISVDGRLDDLNSRVGELSTRVDKLTQVMVQGFIATFAAMLTGFVALAGLIATQL